MSYWRLGRGNGTYWATSGRLNGTNGDDIFDTSAGTAGQFINALGGQDDILGSGFADKIFAGTGHDSIVAGDGADYIHAGSGDNEVDAGPGNDTVAAGAGADLIDGGEGHNRLIGGAGENTIRAGSGNDTIATGGNADIIDAGDGANTINAGNGANRITTGAQADTIRAGTGDDLILAGDGDNRLYAGDGNNTVTSGAGQDNIHCGFGDDLIDAGGGNNRIFAGYGDNTVTSGDGLDTVYAGWGDDVIATGGARDWIHAGGGDNLIDAGAGDDVVYTLAGDSTVAGGTGHDHITLGGGTNHATGGAGNDVIRGAWGFDSVHFAGKVSDFAIGLLGNTARAGAAGADLWQVANGRTLQVRDLTGAEGTDLLRHVEALIFDDATLYLDGRNNAPVVTQTTFDGVTAGGDLRLNLEAFDVEGDALSLVSLEVSEGALISTGLGAGSSYGSTRFELTYSTDGAFADLAPGTEISVQATVVLEDAQGARSTEVIAVTARAPATTEAPNDNGQEVPHWLFDDSFVFDPIEDPQDPTAPLTDLPVCVLIDQPETLEALGQLDVIDCLLIEVTSDSLF